MCFFSSRAHFIHFIFISSLCFLIDQIYDPDPAVWECVVAHLSVSFPLKSTTDSWLTQTSYLTQQRGPAVDILPLQPDILPQPCFLSLLLCGTWGRSETAPGAPLQWNAPLKGNKKYRIMSAFDVCWLLNATWLNSSVNKENTTMHNVVRDEVIYEPRMKRI